MILLIPLIVVIGLYFGVHELQEHIHADAARQHNEQTVKPAHKSTTQSTAQSTTGPDSAEGHAADASAPSDTNNNNE